MAAQTGIVKWLDDGKAFGFIPTDKADKDLFADFCEIYFTGGFRILAEGRKAGKLRRPSRSERSLPKPENAASAAPFFRPSLLHHKTETPRNLWPPQVRG